MRWTEALQGVRVIKFRSVLDRYEASKLTQIDAAALLGVTEWTFRRWFVRFEDAGETGLLDLRLGQASGKRVPSGREEEIDRLYRTHYSGFTAKHFHESAGRQTAISARFVKQFEAGLTKFAHGEPVRKSVCAA